MCLISTDFPPEIDVKEGFSSGNSKCYYEKQMLHRQITMTALVFGSKNILPSAIPTLNTIIIKGMLILLGSCYKDKSHLSQLRFANQRDWNRFLQLEHTLIYNVGDFYFPGNPQSADSKAIGFRRHHPSRTWIGIQTVAQQHLILMSKVTCCHITPVLAFTVRH